MVKTIDLQGTSECNREQQHRERPDQVEEAADDPVDPAAEVPREQGEDDGDEGADQRRADADLERVEPAVEHSHRNVPAVDVGAEHVLPSRVPPLRAEDLHRLDHELPGVGVVVRAAADDRRQLPVHHDLLVDVRRRRSGMGHVARVERRGRAHDQDQDEDAERDEGDVVAAEAAPGEVPRAAPDDRDLVLLGGEGGSAVEGEFSCRLGHLPRFAGILD